MVIVLHIYFILSHLLYYTYSILSHIYLFIYIYIYIYIYMNSYTTISSF